MRELKSRVHVLENEFRRLANREKRYQNDLREQQARIDSLINEKASCLICKHVAQNPTAKGLENTPISIKIRLHPEHRGYTPSMANDISGVYEFFEIVNDRPAYKVI